MGRVGHCVGTNYRMRHLSADSGAARSAKFACAGVSSELRDAQCCATHNRCDFGLGPTTTNNGLTRTYLQFSCTFVSNRQTELFFWLVKVDPALCPMPRAKRPFSPSRDTHARSSFRSTTPQQSAPRVASKATSSCRRMSACCRCTVLAALQRGHAATGRRIRVGGEPGERGHTVF
jgi:hypothetical protein